MHAGLPSPRLREAWRAILAEAREFAERKRAGRYADPEGPTDSPAGPEPGMANPAVPAGRAPGARASGFGAAAAARGLDGNGRPPVRTPAASFSGSRTS